MHFEEAEVNTCIDSCIFREYPCHEDVFILCMTYMVDNDISPQTTAIEGVNMYLQLRHFIVEYSQNQTFQKAKCIQRTDTASVYNANCLWM